MSGTPTREQADALELAHRVIDSNGPADRSDEGKLARAVVSFTAAVALLEERARQAEQELAEVEKSNALNVAWQMAESKRRVAAEARVADLERALRQALDCKGSYEGTVSERGGYPAICTKCEQTAREALAGGGHTPSEPCPTCSGKGEVAATPGQPGDGPMACPECSGVGAADVAEAGE